MSMAGGNTSQLRRIMWEGTGNSDLDVAVDQQTKLGNQMDNSKLEPTDKVTTGSGIPTSGPFGITDA